MEEDRPARRREDGVVLAAIALVAAACLTFRYLPMVDLPQHHAMVSVLRHHSDPAWGFSQRFSFDFVGRPYATVYWLGAALAFVFPLRVAMGLVVALAVTAPLLGLFALQRALGRPRTAVLLVVPFAFGGLFHWGFLNFLAGTGLFLAGLALVVRAATGEGRRGPTLLAALGPVLLLTHFHGLVMLLLVAPPFALATGTPARRAIVRGALPLAPAALLAGVFVLSTWRQAEGAWAQMDPPVSERLTRFPEWLAAGALDPWPTALTVGFFALAAAGLATGRFVRDRRAAAVGLALALQVGLYLALPLNTATATFVCARHAVLVVAFAALALPASRAPGVALGVAGAFAGLGLFVEIRHLAAFDAEARELEPVLAALPHPPGPPGPPRVLPLIFAPRSATTHPTTFPYLHVAAYGMARHGGDLARTFAVVWNVPIRYREGWVRYPIREQLEWAPHLVSADDLRHFDYVLVRGAPRWPAAQRLAGLPVVARSGAFTLLAVPDPLPVGAP